MRAMASSAVAPVISSERVVSFGKVAAVMLALKRSLIGSTSMRRWLSMNYSHASMYDVVMYPLVMCWRKDTTFVAMWWLGVVL